MKKRNSLLRQKDGETPLRVADLVAYLQSLPQDAYVIQSQDSEGNHFAPTRELWNCHYRLAAEDLWVGEGDPPFDAHPAVCFWPIH